MSVDDWSTTADENTSISGINIGEHCPAANINDAIREMMANTKDAFDKSSFPGEVRLFYGTLDSDGHPIPLDWAAQGITTGLSNWHVCDGTNGTPDMRGRVAVGVSDSTALGQALGSDTVTPTITIGETAQQTSLSATTLIVEQIPSHSHWYTAPPKLEAERQPGDDIISSPSGANKQIDYCTYATGGSQSHTHAISNPEHTHTANASIDVRQASCALYHIMRTA